MVSPTFDFTDTIKTSQTLGSVSAKILPTKVWKDMVSKCDLVAALFSHVKNLVLLHISSCIGLCSGRNWFLTDNHNVAEGIFQKGLGNFTKFVLKRRDARFRFMWKSITCITTDITIVRILFSLSLQLMLGQSKLKVVKKLVLKKLKNEKKNDIEKLSLRLQHCGK